jgi:hypothetical protein
MLPADGSHPVVFGSTRQVCLNYVVDSVTMSQPCVDSAIFPLAPRSPPPPRWVLTRNGWNGKADINVNPFIASRFGARCGGGACVGNPYCTRTKVDTHTRAFNPFIPPLGCLIVSHHTVMHGTMHILQQSVHRRNGKLRRKVQLDVKTFNNNDGFIPDQVVAVLRLALCSLSAPWILPSALDSAMVAAM